MSKAVLHQLMLWYNIRKHGTDNSYYWHTAYYLTRFAERFKEPFFKQLVKLLYKSKFTRNKDESDDIDYYRLVAISARWAELELRN